MINNRFYRKLISTVILSIILFIITLISKFDVSIVNKTVTTIILILSLVLVSVFLYFYNSNDKNSRKNKVLYTIIDYYATVVFAFVVIGILNMFVIFPKVNGISMEPTLYNEDSVVVVRHSEINRFDIIVFYIDENLEGAPESEIGNLWCKRVIGLPGDEVSYVNGDLFVNDIYYEEEYINPNPLGSEETILPSNIDGVKIPEGYYLVLGDNRTRSTDSRVIGFISKDLLIGEIKYLITGGIRKVG